MKTVYATVYGKEYTLACDEGQEAHLRQLVAQVSARAERLEKAVGKLPENMMLLYTALMTADELHDAARETTRLKEELATARSAGNDQESTARVEAIQEEMAENLNALAKRLEGLTLKLAA